MTLTPTMQALIVSALSPDYSGTAMADIAVPTAGPGEVLIQVAAAAINFPDVLMTQGLYQHRPALPFTPGMECSGTVVALGDGVDAAWLERAVVASTRTGAMADYVVTPISALRDKPAMLDWAQTAAYSATYLTAYVALVRRAAIQPGDWVLVHGAAGGVGMACVDLARALGARIIATASTAEKRAMITRLYAPEAVIDSAPGFRDLVKAITGGAGADIIVDPVGGDVFDESTRCIAFDGRLLVVGFTSGRIPSINANMPLIKGFSVMGVRAGEYARRFPDRGRENVAAIDALIAQRQIIPHIHAALPLSQWRTGFDLLGQRRAMGKVVLCPESGPDQTT